MEKKLQLFMRDKDGYETDVVQFNGNDGSKENQNAG